MTSAEKKKSTSFSLFSGWNKKEDEGLTSQILQNKILATEEGIETEVVPENEEPELEEEESPDLWKGMAKWFGGGGDDDEGQLSLNVESIIESAREFVKPEETAKTKADVSVEDFRQELKPVLDSLKKNFQDLPFDRFDPASLMYYLEKEDEKKNPSWKRRMHRFCSGVDLSTIHVMHEYLYLAELAYVDSVEEIQEGIANFQTQQNTKYEVVFASAEGEPRKPAHFVLLTKEQEFKKSSKTSGIFRWASLDSSFLEVTIVIRGTKELADMISDAMLEATPYNDGLAHNGICQSGKWIVEKHLPLLNHLLEKSGRKQIKLTLIGHSLGAGAAAIACMEFDSQPNIDATCVAFCCPALLDLEQSNKWKDKITTVVADADCVPRMSGATLYNMLIGVMEHDYKDRALDDVQALLNVLTLKVPLLVSREKQKEALAYVTTKLNGKCKPLEQGMQQKQEVQLFPPGKCYHLYRDGVGYSFVGVGCDFFNELDVAMTMVDDHLVHSGCHAMFLDLMRRHLKNSKFDFPNDLLALRLEKELRAAEKVE